jgi:type IV secretion system protein VirB4
MGMEGKSFGEFTLSVVVYDEAHLKVEHAVVEFQKLFTQHDGLLYEERLQPAQCVLCHGARQPPVQSA